MAVAPLVDDRVGAGAGEIERMLFAVGGKSVFGEQFGDPTGVAPDLHQAGVGLDAEFMDQSSTADDAIQLGAQVAIDEINERGGVLGGRPLQLVTTDNRSVPARGVANVKVLAAKPDIVAYLVGKFSPVVLEQLPHIHTVQLPLLAAWSAAEAITE